MEAGREKVITWEPSSAYGALGKVDGMNDWPRESILAWIELSEKFDVIMKTAPGKKRDNKLSLMVGRRSGIIKDAEVKVRGQNS